MGWFHAAEPWSDPVKNVNRTTVTETRHFDVSLLPTSSTSEKCVQLRRSERVPRPSSQTLHLTVVQDDRHPAPRVRANDRTRIWIKCPTPCAPTAHRLHVRPWDFLPAVWLLRVVPGHHHPLTTREIPYHGPSQLLSGRRRRRHSRRPMGPCCGRRGAKRVPTAPSR
jgi:hypothetical protein